MGQSQLCLKTIKCDPWPKCSGHIIFIPIIIFIFICSCTNPHNPEITFAAKRSDYKIIVDAKGELEAKESKNIAAPRIRGARPEISYLAPEGTKVKQGEIVVELDAQVVKTTYLTALDEVAIAKAEAKKKEAELTLQRLLLEAQIKSTEASLATSKLQLTKLSFEAPNVQELRRVEITKDELELEKNSKKLTSLEIIQKEERIHMQMKIVQAENKLKSSKHSLDKLQLKAPVDGIVVYCVNWSTDEDVKEGEAVYPGMPIVKIPDVSVMQVKLQLGETDAQKISKGDSAVVTVPTVGEFYLAGKVTRIDKIAKPIKRGSKIKKVEVIVELDSTVAGLVPGLTANCSILTKEIKDVVAVPLESVFDHDSLKIVYVLKNRSFVPHPVTLTTQSDDFAFISSGLEDGEKCALREPSSSLVEWPDSLISKSQPTKSDSTQSGQVL